MADAPSQKKRKLEKDNCTEEAKEEKMNVVLAMCGSFNPVTFLHLRLFELAKDWLHSQGKYTVKGGFMTPVHIGYGKKGLVSNEHRLTMCRLATANSDWISVNDWECCQEGWTTTVNVLKQLQEAALKKYSQDNPRLFFLCGADLLESFAKPGLWAPEDIRSIICDFGLVVVSRAGSNPESFIYQSDNLYHLKKHIHLVTEWIPNDVSSTKIRRSLKRGESIRYLVPDPVINYITKHKLYQDNEENE